jgi:hypothetical protein
LPLLPPPPSPGVPEHSLSKERWLWNSLE